MRRASPLALTAVLALSACAGTDPAALEHSCPALTGTTIAAAEIGLPTHGAKIASATFVPATASTPAYCKVLGAIAAVDPEAHAINFQVNLPAAWNGKALQYGGSGFNGELVTALEALPGAGPGDPLPLAQGYATVGTDGGHRAEAFPPGEPAAFALNDEMLENFAFAAYKKAKDAAGVVMRTFYGRAPARMYYFGESEGGREALMMAQRFPADYDGIVSIVPGVSWTAMLHAFLRNGLAQHDDWFEPAKVATLAAHTTQACDALDGLVDGVVSNYLACPARVDVSALRCSGGGDTGASCLSDAEIALVTAIHSPYALPFALANGVTAYPPWLYGHEGNPDGDSTNMAAWMTGSAPPALPVDPDRHSLQWVFGSNWIRYAIARDPALDVRQYDARNFAQRVMLTSALMDATSTDLSAFFARGGRLIVRENAADLARSPLSGMQYYDALVARFGRSVVEEHVRLYASPGSSHNGSGHSAIDRTPLPAAVDLLGPLDRWVSGAETPADLVQIRQDAAPPHATRASRPLCRYPNYPQYFDGDRSRAASYRCVPSGPRP